MTKALTGLAAAACAIVGLAGCGSSGPVTKSSSPAIHTSSTKTDACAAFTALSSAQQGWLNQTDTADEVVTKLDANQSAWGKAIADAQQEGLAKDVPLFTSLQTDVGHMKVDLSNGDVVTAVLDNQTVVADEGSFAGVVSCGG